MDGLSINPDRSSSRSQEALTVSHLSSEDTSSNNATSRFEELNANFLEQRTEKLNELRSQNTANPFEANLSEDLPLGDSEFWSLFIDNYLSFDNAPNIEVPTVEQPSPEATSESEIEEDPLNIIELGLFEDTTVTDNPNDVNENGLSDHAEQVAQIAGTVAGINSEDIQAYNFNANPEVPERFNNLALNTEASESDVNNYIDILSSSLLDDLTEGIERNIDSGTIEGQVINVSLGFGRTDIYEQIYDLANENPEIQNIVKDGNTENNLYQSVVNYVDNHIDTEDSAFNQSLANYQRFTEEAASEGTFIVVSAGNSRDNITERSDITFLPGAESNFLTMSEHVISVAASAENNPGVISDNTVTNFSSHGNGEFNPTVSAIGEDIHVAGFDQPVRGTSFSAPQISGLIYRILKENPDMTFDQVVAYLQNNAFDTSSSVEAEGAGFIDAFNIVA